VLSEEVEVAINKQINAEIYSAYLYYAMAAHFESLSLKGFAHWMRVQTLEELTHVQRFVNYVSARGGRVAMRSVEAPTTDWESPLSVFEAVYAHEVSVTKLVNQLMDLALAKSDHATVSLLGWFVTEQVEEEASADEIVQRLKLAEKTEGGVLLLDQELDKRSFVLPPDLAGSF
jgi:ferritin